ncbi:hypothetical protein QCN29_26100 [Streptomyces sp. HNM0663]|uniref:Integral membrane protein n=1 Tax=Streptomyces chengmaiensis TaxID=3040919 RepID=A0ABT6HV42_9ACTN|nr:hypothetical protein [Streptomyces chengmaiensis]MDH2392192.1 hypothetical protein [Streptomyces chengmaiensis]
MTTNLVDAAEADRELIGRCYTKARRAPLVHGVIRDVNGGRGIRLPGGPYTLTQLAAIVTTFVVLILTRAVWGGHGFLDAVLLLGLPFTAAFLLRHLHIDGRNPAAALVSVMTMLTGPQWGRLHGRPYRPARPTRRDARITLTPSGERPAPAATAVRPTPAIAPPAARPAAVPPATGAATGAPVASGVQALLGRRTASAPKED